MSDQTEDPIVWIGGEHRFCLRLKELRTLQKNCDAGPEEVLNRLRLGTWRVDDIIEPIRLGLIGSGEMAQSEAGPFVTKLVHQHPLAEFKLTATLVLFLSLIGPGDDEPEKPMAGEGNPESGPSPASGETAP